MKKIVVDLKKCTGCGQCALACAFIKTELFDLNQSNIHVIQWEDICLSVPMMCQQCHDASCIEICPTEALSWDPQLHVIRLDREACTQCEACREECTFQVIHMTDEAYPMTCDQCNGDPACVKSCYPGALSYLEVAEDSGEQFREVVDVLIARSIGKNVPPPDLLLREGDLSIALGQT
jgi:anaerobic carbon-monoxide dehydrogenase iron sulfur subunit